MTGLKGVTGIVFGIAITLVAGSSEKRETFTNLTKLWVL